eukprot:g4241.t1
MTRVAINGFGRIGRNILRAWTERNDCSDLEIVAINDLGDTEMNAHLLQYDSVHGKLDAAVSATSSGIKVGDKQISCFSERNPASLPWKDYGVDLVLECTGLFTSQETASAHLEAGASKVLISAPGKNVDATIVYGVNHGVLAEQHNVVSNASCTTNCLAPVAYALNQGLGIEKDVLLVQLLMRESGCENPLPVAPLFETLNDLNNAADVIGQLVNMPWYRGQIGGEQTVMIGYSDSAKDAGVMAAGWAQYRAQESLLKVCEDANVSLRLFHGRGGTIGRGGAPAQAALLSQPPGSLAQGLRVTEQGEMIRAKLGLNAIAIKSLALYTSAILQANLDKPPVPLPEWRDLMDQLSDLSCEDYRSVVRGHEDFVPYFRSATPELELGKLPLGSRPARRKAGGGIESLRAIPWIFAWSQNRLMLPAWLGAGAALQKVIDSGNKKLLEEMCQQWPFFSTRISMLEMVYAKSDSAISAYYDSVLVEESQLSLGKALRSQLEKDIETVLSITNDDSLMDDLPQVRASVDFRNTYVDPLNLLQAELLRRNREQQDDNLEQAIMVTIAGISAGLRNTG